MNDHIKVVVVDDQNISRGFFEMYVMSSNNYELVASLRYAKDAIVFVEKHDVDLVILDIMMQEGIDGLMAAKSIKEKFPAIKIILTTSTAETRWENEARKIGVESFWYKEYDHHSLIDIMDLTMQGQHVYPNVVPEVHFGNIKRSDLTERELDVLRELTASLTNEEIGERLCISPNTVKRHIQNMMDKTGFTSRLELAIHAKSLGLVVSEEERKKHN